MPWESLSQTHSFSILCNQWHVVEEMLIRGHSSICGNIWWPRPGMNMHGLHYTVLLQWGYVFTMGTWLKVNVTKAGKPPWVGWGSQKRFLHVRAMIFTVFKCSTLAPVAIPPNWILHITCPQGANKSTSGVLSWDRGLSLSSKGLCLLTT